MSSEIKWECFDGLPSNMKKLNEEFNLYRDLKPVRVWVTGPPAVGKTYFSKKLVHEYNIPHINIPMLVDEF